MINRYSTKRISELWTEENKYNSFLKIELANLEVLLSKKIITLSEFNKIKQNSKVNIKRINEIEQKTKHDVIAFVNSISEQLGQESKWFHYGLTSTDIVDSAQAYILKNANLYILESLDKFIDVLKKKAFKYKSTPCIGRTHGIHAEVTSFGLKWANWYDEMIRNRERFILASKNIETIKISGAVGNHANVSKEIQDKISKILKLNSANISTQVISRDLHLSYIMSIASVASTVEKIALEIRHLQRTEIREVEEYFSKGQKGSSAMPHKRNPIASENICGISRVIRSYVQPAFENNILWHERDISHSSVERIILPDITNLIDYMLNRYTDVIENLVVYEKQMLKNIDLTNGVIYSQRALNYLIEVKKMNRQEAYDLVQPIAIEAYNENISFKDLLLKNKITSKILNSKTLSELFDPKYYLKEIDVIFKAVFK